MMLEIVSLILQFATDLVAGTCLLRFYMNWQGIALSVRSGHPLARFVFAATNWAVLPLRRVLPSVGACDTASLLAAYALVLSRWLVLWLLTGALAPLWTLLPVAALGLLSVAISGLTWLVIGYALMSWLSTRSEITYFVAQLVEPLLRPVRRFLPHLGGVDLSPLVVLLLLQIAQMVLHSLPLQRLL